VQAEKVGTFGSRADPRVSVRRVWIVDDSGLDAQRAARVLIKDYEVETFCDGSAVLERLATSDPPDVVILDWVMPGISGVEVCRFLRGHEGRQGLAILLLTAHRHTEQIVEGLSAGANDYLAKPYEDEELRARVGALVRSRVLLERAEEAEAAHRRLLETAPDPLLVVDDQGRLRFVNAKAAQMLSQTGELLLGRSLSALVPELANAHLTPAPDDSVLPAGDVTIANRRFSPTLTAGQGSTTIALRDVTERRILEERRLDFYSIIAHDLRTPLSAMTLRLALLGTGASLDARAKQDVEKLQERLRSLVNMINDFLELASLEGVSYRLHRSQVDLKKLIEEVVEEYRPLLERGGVAWAGIETSGDAEPSVLGDPKRLGQVFGNLIGNAVKFTAAGGSIAARIDQQPRYFEVSVRDNGAGIEQSVLPTLFERYTRAQHNASGTGLGLMIVKEIVEAHGGTVGVESALGEGSRFWVRLSRR
jgi:two-component system phosphate regulon sensor histidine kinase PhoR